MYHCSLVMRPVRLRTQVLHSVPIPSLAAAPSAARAAAARAPTNGAAVAAGAKRKRAEDAGPNEGAAACPGPSDGSRSAAPGADGNGPRPGRGDQGLRPEPQGAAAANGSNGSRGGGVPGGACWGGEFGAELDAVLAWCAPRLAWQQLRAQLAHLGAPFDEEWALASPAKPGPGGPGARSAAAANMPSGALCRGPGSGLGAQHAQALPNGRPAANGAAAAGEAGRPGSGGRGVVEVPVLAAQAAPLQRALLVRGFERDLRALDAVAAWDPGGPCTGSQPCAGDPAATCAPCDAAGAGVGSGGGRPGPSGDAAGGPGDARQPELGACVGPCVELAVDAAAAERGRWRARVRSAYFGGLPGSCGGCAAEARAAPTDAHVARDDGGLRLEYSLAAGAWQKPARGFAVWELFFACNVLYCSNAAGRTHTCSAAGSSVPWAANLWIEVACHGQQTCGVTRSLTGHPKPCLHRKRPLCDGRAHTAVQVHDWLSITKPGHEPRPWRRRHRRERAGRRGARGAPAHAAGPLRRAHAGARRRRAPQLRPRRRAGRRLSPLADARQGAAREGAGFAAFVKEQCTGVQGSGSRSGVCQLRG